MNHFWNNLSPQVQVEIIKTFRTAILVAAGSVLVLFLKFRLHNQHEGQNDKQTTEIEFEGGFKKE